MIVWNSKFVREVERADEIVYKRRDCQWILPQALASHLKYNPRHLPVVPAHDTLSAGAMVPNATLRMLAQCIVQHAARS